MNPARYDPVSQALAGDLPAITNYEAARAVKKIYKKFGRTESGSYLNVPTKIRKCWLSPKSTQGHIKGWGRLVHDVSHRIFRVLNPHRNPHHPAHAFLERDIAIYVAESGWLSGKLKPKEKILTKEEKRLAKLAKIEKSIDVWERKLKRAQNAIKKLTAKHKRIISYNV